MSKVDEWLIKQEMADKIKPWDFADGCNTPATICGDTGDIIANGIIRKDVALKFAKWIIENYGD